MFNGVAIKEYFRINFIFCIDFVQKEKITCDSTSYTALKIANLSINLRW